MSRKLLIFSLLFASAFMPVFAPRDAAIGIDGRAPAGGGFVTTPSTTAPAPAPAPIGGAHSASSGGFSVDQPGGATFFSDTVSRQNNVESHYTTNSTTDAQGIVSHTQTLTFSDHSTINGRPVTAHAGRDGQQEEAVQSLLAAARNISGHHGVDLFVSEALRLPMTG